MFEVTVSREMRAPADAVWAAIVDLDTAPERLSGVTAVERLDGGGGFGLGTHWRETRVMFGREATEEMTVTAIDPGRSYTVEAENNGALYISGLSVTPTDDGSRLHMTFRAVSRTFVAKVLGKTVGRLFESATRKAMQRDLLDIAASVEA